MLIGVKHYSNVSDLTAEIKESLQTQFSFISLEAEISNFKAAASGHWYFTLKDEGAMLQAVMFRGTASRVSFLPDDGVQVRVTGSITVYAQRGQYQIICESMEQAGLGRILQTLELRRQKLAAEGLFNLDRKRPIPKFPRIIGVVTSPSGAAIRDILKVLKRRNRSSRVVILPCLVQGSGAPAEITAQIQRANFYRLAEVLIIGRGGGSLEDLLAFSDESVVRAIAASDIPVISAVGHETDSCLADFAADLRAPTPSAAAELVSQAQDELYQAVFQLARSIVDSFLGRRERLRLAIKPFGSHSLEDRFRSYLVPGIQRLDLASEAIQRDMKDLLRQRRQQVEKITAEILALSPYAVLQRGFSIVRKLEDGQVLKDASSLSRGQKLDIQFARGRAAAEIIVEGES